MTEWRAQNPAFAAISGAIPVLDRRATTPTSPDFNCTSAPGRIGAAEGAFEALAIRRVSRRASARPAISEKRLSLSPQGRVRYPLKTPWKNGTKHVEFERIYYRQTGGVGTATARTACCRRMTPRRQRGRRRNEARQHEAATNP